MAAIRHDLELIKPGDFVCLTDEQTIKDMMESGMPVATEGLHLEVERVTHIRERHGMCEWYLCPLSGTCPENYPQLWLLCKAVDSEFEIRVYWVPDEFQYPRTRGDLLNDGIFWLFKEPKDDSDFRPCELEFTGWIDHDSGSGITKFDAKTGELHGDCRETPTPSGQIQPQPATVVEYGASQEGVEDSEVLVLEVGGLNEYGEQVAEGGVVHFFLGSPIANCDIDLIQHKTGKQE